MSVFLRIEIKFFACYHSLFLEVGNVAAANVVSKMGIKDQGTIDGRVVITASRNKTINGENARDSRPAPPQWQIISNRNSQELKPPVTPRFLRKATLSNRNSQRGKAKGERRG